MTDTLATNWLISWCADAEGDKPESSSYLGVQSIEIHVSDLDESRKFYLDNLGFWLLLDTGCDTENRCVVVAPPDRSAVLALVKSTESSRKVLKVGANTGITLVTDNIADKFREWSARGVRFSQMPVSVPAGIQATFEDVDGNEFNLLESPWLVDFLNSQQRAAEERREVKRRLTLEMEIAKDIQEKLFPRRLPYLMTMEYAGRCVQAHQVGGDYYVSERGAGTSRVRCKRCCRQGHSRCLADGQPPGGSPQPVRPGSSRSPRSPRISKWAFARKRPRQRLCHAVLRELRGQNSAVALPQLRPSARAPSS